MQPVIIIRLGSSKIRHFYRNPEFALKSSKGVNEGASEGANERVKSLLEYIHKNPGQRVPSMSQSLEMAPKTLERWLKQLKDKGKIKFDGSAKTGGYYVVDKNQ